nr:anhydro-N-acetylmuramic acid kinase [Mangrovimonas sp. ST2L15]
MIMETFNVVGVMSGTSLDGIDLAYVTFTKLNGTWQFDCHDAVTVSYPPNWKRKLQGLVGFSKDDLLDLDVEYTDFLAHIIVDFVERYPKGTIDMVCSHGHTALHQPERGLTYQIGNLPEISKKIGLPVVCDFRIEDVALGGQGAPLVPIGDQLLFGSYDYCLNLGGFANVSMQVDGNRIAYDICPVNIVLNHYMSKVGKEFDAGGVLAKSGDVDQELLKELNAIPFYGESYPKSLGLEWVNTEVYPRIDSCSIELPIILRTFVEHIAFQIGQNLHGVSSQNILVTGGGAHNQFLMERIKSHAKPSVIIPETLIVDFKEAIVFGFLGVLKMQNEINCLKSVTGARKDHSSGMIYYP